MAAIRRTLACKGVVPGMGDGGMRGASDAGISVARLSLYSVSSPRVPERRFLTGEIF
jgi:hypothetical protein